LTTDESELEPADLDQNPLDPTYGDLALTGSRALLALFTGPVGSFVGELAPSATDRQHERAIRTLQRLVQELREIPHHMWTRAEGGEEFDAAYVRAERAAHEAAEEQKRELIWYGLINGWVRTNGSPARKRFQRLVGQYDLEHFEILKQMQGLVTQEVQWFAFETSEDGKTLVSLLTRDRSELLPYLQRFHADGLVMIYDQPDIKQSGNGPWVTTNKLVLWKSDADRLLEFVMDPRNMLFGALAVEDE
jgi:hypothetical protein